MNNYLNGAKRGGLIYTATLLLFLAVSLIGRTVLVALKISDTLFYVLSSLFSVIAFTCATFLYVKKGNKPLLFKKFSPVYIVPSLLLAFGMLFGLGFLNLFVAEGVKSLGGVISEAQIPLDTPLQYVLFTVFLCAFPAIAEELFFRGVLMDCLSGVKKAVAVITVALCFALYHGNVAQLCYQFIYGLGLGFLTLKAQSVIPAMVAHFINNFAVLSIEYFKIPVNLKSAVLIIIGSALLVNFVLFLIFYGNKPVAEKERTESVKDFYIPFGAMGIAVAVIIIILSALPIG